LGNFETNIPCSLKLSLRPAFVQGFYFFVLFLAACSSARWYPSIQYATSSPVGSASTEDSVTLAVIKPYKDVLDSGMKVVIGSAEKELTKGRPESTLGNFVADALLLKAIDVYGMEVDMAAVTSGGLRTNLKQGQLTVGDLYELMPFDNELWILTLTPTQVEQMFYYLYERQNLSVSNTKVVFDKYGHMRLLEINGMAFDATKSYRLAISDYLAKGGDGMQFFTVADSAVTSHYKVRDALIDYIKELDADSLSVNAYIEERVILEK
jgi:2',3'-cyclic-nucleotide 2'-phosphodiesterase (5'-nucleotidase family)